MLYPIAPIFITTVLGASVFSLGFIEGLAEAIASLLKTYSGVWSDRLGKRKQFIWVGYLFAAISKPLIGFSQSWVHVLAAKILDRTGKGIRTGPRDALLAESVPAHQRGAAFGFHRMMDTMGAALGPLLAILFLKYSANLRLMYFIAFIPGMLAVSLALSLKETAPAENKQIQAKKSWLSFLKLPSNFIHYLVAWGLFSLTNSSDVFLLLKTQQAGVGLQETILMYCFYNLVYSLGSPYLGGLSDRVGRKRVLLFGLFIFTLVYVGFIFADKRFQFWGLFGVYGLYMAATEGVGKAFAIDILGEDKKATAGGYLGTVTGISTLIASTTAGFLWQYYGSAATFFFGAVGSSLAFLVLSQLSSSSTQGDAERYGVPKSGRSWSLLRRPSR
jgi:MFS family permease